MDVVFFEDAGFRDLLPLVYWRPVCRLRCGRYPLFDRAAARLGAREPALWVRPELADVARARHHLSVNEPAGMALLCNQRWIPQTPPLLADPPQAGEIDGDIAYIHCDERLRQSLDPETLLSTERLSEALRGVPRVAANGWILRYPWDLVHRNADHLRLDWEAGDGEIAGDVHPGAHLVCREAIHVGAGAAVGPGVVLDAAAGPIFLEQGVQVLPNAVIGGPAFIGRDSVINAGAWIHGGVSIGPGCKVGGEVAASIVHALSNKQHHGFLGHSYVAEWVNIGAGTTTSNLKNTYGTITVMVNGIPVDSGQQFVGAIVGDFAKIAINQSLATGTIIGLGSSVALSGRVPKFVPSLRFVSQGEDEPYDVERCLDVAGRAMARRRVEMLPAERALFRRLPELAARVEGV